MTSTDDRTTIDELAAKRANGGPPSLVKAAQLLGLPAIQRVTRPDSGGESPLTVEAGERTIRWERQRDMLLPRSLVFPALAAGFGPKKPLTPAQSQTVYRALVAAAETAELADALGQARDWIDRFTTAAEVITIRPDADAVATFVQLQGFRDERNPWFLLAWGAYRYIRRSDLGTFVRETLREQISYETLAGRVGEIGWSRHDLQAWTPDVPRRDAEHVRVRTYRRLIEESS